ncbi:ribosomal protein L2 family isoform X2 [Wolffia australiana]
MQTVDHKRSFWRSGAPMVDRVNSGGQTRDLYSYILASDGVEVGAVVMNCDRAEVTPGAAQRHGILDPNSHVGNCLPLRSMRMGTWVHDVECRPGQGAKLARAAGTFAKVVKEPGDTCRLRLPSGEEKEVDSRCRATVGVGSNPGHARRKLAKAGNSRWLGRRPVVRGVAMNPVDHPHGGGEGRTKGGRPSVTPWGKPTKSGYRTVIRKKAH